MHVRRRHHRAHADLDPGRRSGAGPGCRVADRTRAGVGGAAAGRRSPRRRVEGHAAAGPPANDASAAGRRGERESSVNTYGNGITAPNVESPQRRTARATSGRCGTGSTSGSAPAALDRVLELCGLTPAFGQRAARTATAGRSRGGGVRARRGARSATCQDQTRPFDGWPCGAWSARSTSAGSSKPA